MEHGPTAFPVPGATPSRRLGLAPTTSKFGYRSSRGLLYNSAELSLLERRIGLASTINRDSFGSLQRGITPRVDPATLTIPHREGLRPLVGKLQSPPMVSSRTLQRCRSEARPWVPLVRRISRRCTLLVHSSRGQTAGAHRRPPGGNNNDVPNNPFHRRCGNLLTFPPRSCKAINGLSLTVHTPRKHACVIDP